MKVQTKKNREEEAVSLVVCLRCLVVYKYNWCNSLWLFESDDEIVKDNIKCADKTLLWRILRGFRNFYIFDNSFTHQSTRTFSAPY